MSIPRIAKAVIGGALVAAVCLAGVHASRRSEERSKRTEIKRSTELVAFQIANRLRVVLEQHRIALEQMAGFLGNREETEAEFLRLAAKTVDLGPQFLRIVALDPDSRIRWVYPDESHRALVGVDLRSHRPGYETILRAREAGTAVLSPPLDLVDGPRGFVMLAPAVAGGDRLDVIAGAFHAADFFRVFVSPKTLGQYEKQIADEEVPLFESESYRGAAPEIPFAIESVEIGGRRWEIRLRPRSDLFAASVGAGRAAHWVLGVSLAMALAALTGGAVYGGSSVFARLRDQREALGRTRERLEDAHSKLIHAEKLTAVGELVAGVAHEISNPLSTILGYSQLLAGRETRPDVKARLQIIADEAARTGKIVRNLLTFSRKHPPERELVQLNRIVEKTLELKSYHLQSNGIEVVRDLDPTLPSTLLDFHQIQQVLLNLLNNAEHAILEREKRGRITVATGLRGSMVELRVMDDGPGIPETIRERIFEPFFTTKGEGKGTGLGLPLCLGIVSEHGGTIEAESSAGDGATFVVQLPWIQAAPVSETSRRNAVASQARLRILVVDDEAHVREMLAEALVSREHHVTTVGDVQDAMDKIASERFDVVILDMNMRGGAGREFHAAVTQHAPDLARRIVYTTGDGASVEMRGFLESTGGVVVPKPYKFEELERTVKEAARRHGTGPSPPSAEGNLVAAVKAWGVAFPRSLKERRT